MGHTPCLLWVCFNAALKLANTHTHTLTSKFLQHPYRKHAMRLYIMCVCVCEYYMRLEVVNQAGSSGRQGGGLAWPIRKPLAIKCSQMHKQITPRLVGPAGAAHKSVA